MNVEATSAANSADTLFTLDGLSKHLVLVSTISLVVASGLTVIFVFAYLSVFDYNLIWLVEYTDVAKFIALSAAPLYLFLGFILGVTAPLYASIVSRTISIRFAASLSLGCIVLLYLALFAVDYTYAGFTWRYELSLAITLFLLFLATIAALFLIARKLVGNLILATLYLSIFLLFLGFAGRTLAYNVISGPRTHEVTLRNSLLKDQKIIMLLSHHSVFFEGGVITVVPTSDILEISTNTGLSPK